jgi:hypothetical protein
MSNKESLILQHLQLKSVPLCMSNKERLILQHLQLKSEVQEHTLNDMNSLSTRRDSSRVTMSTTMPKDDRYKAKRPSGAYATKRSASSVPMRTCITARRVMD